MTIDEVKRELFSSSEDVLGNDMVDLYEAQECCDTSFNIGYCKAIDDLSENLCCAFSENSTKGECEGFTCDILTLDIVSDLVISVSEQLRQQN